MTKSSISPLAFIGEGVILGERVSIGPGAVLLGPCVIEDDVYIGSGAQIGGPPEMSDQAQNAAWCGELKHAGVHIGNRAVIREGVVIHQGTYRATTVGAESWVLNRAYLAHDVLTGKHSTISSGVAVGGHCIVGDRVNIGMNAAVHQRTFIGAGCMVGMSTPVTRDLPPHAKVFGSPARLHGLNEVGLSRLGAPEDQISALWSAYQDGNILLDGLDASIWQGPLAADVLQWRSQETRRPISMVVGA